MPDEHVFEFALDLALGEALSSCLEIARTNHQWQVDEQSVTDDSFSFHVAPSLNPFNPNLSQPYHYQIRLFPSGSAQTRVQFSADYHDQVSGSALLEYIYLRSRLALRAPTTGSDQEPQSGLIADLTLDSALYQSIRSTQEALQAAGAQNIFVSKRQSHYELFEFDLPGQSMEGTALVRGLDRYSRVTVEVPHYGINDLVTRQFISDFEAHLATIVNFETTYILKAEDPDPAPNTESPLARTHIFISYRRDDTGDVSGRIYDRLERHYDREMLFKDVDTIPLGADFRKVIGDAVSQCRVLLAVIGSDWLSTANEQGTRRLDDPADFVRLEIESALQREIPVIPVLVRGASMPAEADLPDSLKPLVYRQAVQVRSDPDFHSDMDRLIRGIEYLFGRN